MVCRAVLKQLEKKRRKKPEKKKRQNVVRCDASIQYRKKKRRTVFFCFSIEKNRAKGKGW
jgi:hypothetical protein